MIVRVMILMAMAAALAVAFAGCGSGDGSESAGQDPAAEEGAVTDKVVSFETQDLEKNAVRSEELFAANKVTMINIWGTFCGPCINEMADIEAIHQEYADKGVAVVGLVVDVPIGNDDYLKDAEEIIKETGVTYLNIRAWEGFDTQMPIPGVPTTYFFDSQGNILGEPVVGAYVDKYSKELDKYLE